MNKKIIVIILIIVAILIPYRLIEDSRQSFEIYLASGDSDDMNSLVLSSKPVLTDKDIVSYKWDTHEIELNRVYLGSVHSKAIDQSGDKPLEYLFYGGSKLLGTTYKDKFVIVVNGEKVYCGCFPKPAHFSSINVGPIIVDTQGGIAIKFFPYPTSMDLRDDTRIYDVLKSKGKLRQ